LRSHQELVPDGQLALQPVDGMPTVLRRLRIGGLPLPDGRLFRRTAILFRKVCVKIHRLMQDSSDLQGVGSGDAVEKEMPRLANSIPGPSRGLAAEIEMIRSAICGDFRALTAAGAFGIIRDLLNRCRNKLCVSLQRLRAKIFFRPGKDARDVASRLRSDDDFHFLKRRSSRRSS
jgi:hypothetical protein